MVSRPHAPAKKRTSHPTRVHALKGNRFAKLDWDSKSRGYVGQLISAREASSLAANLHPPEVVPIRGDPQHVILYLWDVTKNEYDGGEMVSINDPRLPGNSPQ